MDYTRNCPLCGHRGVIVESWTDADGNVYEVIFCDACGEMTFPENVEGTESD